MDAITVTGPAPFDGLGSVPNSMRFACHFIIDVRVRPGYIDGRGQLSKCCWTCCDHFMVANHNGLIFPRPRWWCYYSWSHPIQTKYLTHWGRATQICVSKLTIIGSDNSLVPSHYLNHCWNIVGWTHRNKLQCNLNGNSYIVIQGNIFEYGVWTIAAILCVALMCWIRTSMGLNYPTCWFNGECVKNTHKIYMSV